jgi:hypothetical protein
MMHSLDSRIYATLELWHTPGTSFDHPFEIKGVSMIK